MTIFCAIWTLLLCSIGIIYTYALPRRFLDRIIIFWARTCLMIVGVGLNVKGRENLPPSGAIYIFNHTSFLDIFVVFTALDRPTRFGAKAELFKVPIFGDFLRVAGFIPIARDRGTEVFKLYREAGERVANGESFILAPEGARQADGTKLGRFKSGPMVFAIEAGVPIVPVVLWGPHHVWPKKGKVINAKSWYSKVDVSILPAVDATQFTYETRKDLTDLLFSQMQGELQKMSNH